MGYSGSIREKKMGIKRSMPCSLWHVWEEKGQCWIVHKFILAKWWGNWGFQYSLIITVCKSMHTNTYTLTHKKQQTLVGSTLKIPSWKITAVNFRSGHLSGHLSEHETRRCEFTSSELPHPVPRPSPFDLQVVLYGAVAGSMQVLFDHSCEDSDWWGMAWGTLRWPVQGQY